MIGVGPPPTYNNIEALQGQYYAQCLQAHIEAIEVLLDEGLGFRPVFGNQLGVEFDLDGLLRMDTATVKAGDALKSGALAPNEARARYFDLPPTEGGESPYLQIQNYSLAALARRDANSTPVTPGLDQTNEAARSLADEAEARRVRALREAAKEFNRLAIRNALMRNH